MNGKHRQANGGTLSAALPHPGVLIFALLLAIAGAWFGMPASEDNSSVAASAMLRRQSERAKAQYLRASRQAATTRALLTAAQGRLERYAHDQFEELHHAVQMTEAIAPVNTPLVDTQVLSEAAADGLESQRLHARLADLSRERSDLLVRLTPEHPSVRDIDSQIVDVQRLIDVLPKLAEPVRLPVAIVDQAELQAQERIRRHWSALVDGALVGSQQIEQECHQIGQELSALEAQRGVAEKNYLASSDAVAAAVVARALEVPKSKELANVLLGCAIGLPLLALAGRAVAQLGFGRDQVIRHTDDIERFFRLPVVGWVGSGGGAAGSTAQRALPLVLQVCAAVLVFLLVAMTVQDPSWLTRMWSHPIDVVRHAVGNLGAS